MLLKQAQKVSYVVVVVFAGTHPVSSPPLSFTQVQLALVVLFWCETVSLMQSQVALSVPFKLTSVPFIQTQLALFVSFELMSVLFKQTHPSVDESFVGFMPHCLFLLSIKAMFACSCCSVHDNHVLFTSDLRSTYNENGR